jgi:hypothetical protein
MFNGKPVSGPKSDGGFRVPAERLDRPVTMSSCLRSSVVRASSRDQEVSQC